MQLINLFPSWMTGGGIFAKMTGMPWSSTSSIDTTALDIEYFGNRSGYKEASPLLTKMFAPEARGPLSTEEINRIISVIKTMYGDTWARLWALRNKTYEPLENYDMTQLETRNLSNKHTGTVVDDAETTKSEGSTEIHKIKQDVTTETGVATNLTKETGVATNLTKETGVATNLTKETGVATNMTKETTTEQDIERTTSHATNTTHTEDRSVYGLGAGSTAAPESTTTVTDVGAANANKDTETIVADPSNNVITENTTGSASNNKTTETTTGTAANNKTTETTTGSASGNKTTETTTGTASANKTTTQVQASEDNNKETITRSADADDNKETYDNTRTHNETMTDTGTVSLTRHGNIGVTTSQQMAQAEIELWKWHYFETVFSDIDRVLTTPYWR